MTATREPPPDGPFPTLSALQDAHRALLAAVGEASLAPPRHEPVEAFVRRGAATGRVLDARDDRRAAQGHVNYWVSALAAAVRRGDLAARGAADPRETLLADFDPAVLAEAAAAADRWIDALPADEAVLVRRVLIRLVRLHDDLPALSNAVSRLSLHDLEPQHRVDAVLARLEELGVVRVARGPGGASVISLRDDSLLTGWPRLAALIASRREFRRIAEAWRASEAAARGPGRLRRAARRLLLALGRPVDLAWTWLARKWSGSVLADRDPADDLPDLEYYRDRNQAEIDYLFRRRDRAVEKAEWLRLIKGLMVVGLVVLVAFAAFTYAARKYETEAIKDAEYNRGREHEFVRRRARQRLKEHVALIRLLAQHRQYDNPRDFPRSRLARWRIETPIVDSPEDVRSYQAEWEEIGVKSAAQTVAAEGTLPPLQVARKLRQMVEPRFDKRSADFDPDTETYLKHLKRDLYATTRRLLDELRLVLSQPGTDLRPHNYAVLAGYIDEFWVLYHGEMAVVESPEVEAMMVKVGERLKGLDAVFGAELHLRVGQAGGRPPAADSGEPTQTAAARSFAWRNDARPDDVSAARSKFLQQPLRAPDGTLALASRERLAQAIAALFEDMKPLAERLAGEEHGLDR